MQALDKGYVIRGAIAKKYGAPDESVIRVPGLGCSGLGGLAHEILYVQMRNQCQISIDYESLCLFSALIPKPQPENPKPSTLTPPNPCRSLYISL